MTPRSSHRHSTINIAGRVLLLVGGFSVISGCIDEQESTQILTALQRAGWDRAAAAAQMKIKPEQLLERMQANKVCVSDSDCAEDMDRCIQRHPNRPWASNPVADGDCRKGAAPPAQFSNVYYCDSGTGRYKERFSFCATEYDTWLTLGNEVVTAEVLNAGLETYMLNCRPCHGEKGDGVGPASYFLRPPPRDLRIATYKFTGVKDGLPHDEDFHRILVGGLTGTAMLPWDLPETEIPALIHYIKTFSPLGEGWQENDPDFSLGERVVPPADPWQDTHKAVKRGELLYHAKAMCWSCHPSYVTQQEIYDASLSLMKEGLRSSAIDSFRPAVFLPEAKASASYKVDGINLSILPPDFLQNPVRSISVTRPNEELTDLYRIIGAGIGGTAMPPWAGALPDKDVWALVHYVYSLVEMKDTKKASALRAKLARAPLEIKKAAPAEAKPAAEAQAAPAAAATAAN